MTVVALALATLAGCSASRPRPTISAVTPPKAYTDLAVPLTIDAPTIQPGFDLNLSSGAYAPDPATLQVFLDPLDGSSPPIALTTVVWDEAHHVVTLAPAGLPAGLYTVRVVDPAGDAAILEAGFESLGPDQDPPVVTFESPKANVFVASPQAFWVQASAEDGFGAIASMSWTGPENMGGDCAVPPPALGTRPIVVPCQFQTRPPTEPQASAAASAPPPWPFTINVTATDTVGLSTTASLTLRQVRAPIILSVDPVEGPLVGGQPFIVYGKDFQSGAMAWLGGEYVVGQYQQTDDGVTTIRGFVPPRNRAENVDLSVVAWVGGELMGASITFEHAFTYLGPPHPREVLPSHGPPSGGIRISVRGNDLRYQTTLWIGATRASAVPLGSTQNPSSTQITGCLPPGTGKVSIFAEDPVSGMGTLPDAFTYDDTPVGGPEPTSPPVSPDPSCQ